MVDHPEVDVLGGRMKLINENDTKSGEYFSVPMKNNELRLKMLFINYMSHSTAMIRYNEKNKEFVHYNMICAEDYDLWLRLMFTHNFTFEIMDHFMIYYRTHT